MEYATRGRFGGLGLKTTSGRFSGLGLNLGAAPVGIEGGTWCHHEACIEVKLSDDGRVAVGCFCLKLDHYVLEVKWFRKISRGMLRMCNNLYK